MIIYIYDILTPDDLTITELRELMNHYGQKGIKVKVLHIEKIRGGIVQNCGNIILQTTQEVATIQK
ncbi:MAG: hypothetical protein WC575_01190 [Patescibacteria group bacterium]